MMKVHLDTDIGGDIDDLCALAMLLKWPGVEISGITTVSDEGGRRAGYARYALGLAGRSGIPVAAGADVDLVPYRWRPTYPSENNYWPEPVSPSPNPIDEALELLKSSIEVGATVVAIGPVTNLALFDRRFPGLLGDARLCLMGGFIGSVPPGYPQRDNESDYNLQMDVESARRIIERYKPLLVPLTVSVQTALRRAHLPGLREAGPLGALIARQAEAYARDERYEERYGRTYPGLPADIINFQHDPLACAVALGWEGAAIEELPLVLDTKDGWLRERVGEAGATRQVVTAVDGPGFSQFWYDLVTSA